MSNYKNNVWFSSVYTKIEVVLYFRNLTPVKHSPRRLLWLWIPGIKRHIHTFWRKPKIIILLTYDHRHGDSTAQKTEEIRSKKLRLFDTSSAPRIILLEYTASRMLNGGRGKRVRSCQRLQATKAFLWTLR